MSAMLHIEVLAYFAKQMYITAGINSAYYVHKPLGYIFF